MTRDPTNENTNLPPWLRDVPLPPRPRGAQERAGADTSGSAAPASPPPNESLPGWLRDSSADTAGPAIETPGWADSPAQTRAPPLAGDQAALPDWLRDTQSSMPASAPSEQLPSWLRDLAEPEAAAQEPAAPSTPASAAPPPQEGNLPDWLRDTQRDNPPPTSAEQLPSWLADTVETPGPVEPAATPDWLRDPGGAATTPPADAGVPDWLSAGDEPATSPADTGEPGNTTHTGPSGYETAEIPAWLSGGDKPATPPADTGDTTHTGLSGYETIELWGPVPNIDSGPPRTTGSDAAIPDWLRDISAEDPSEGITAEPFSFEGATSAPQSTEPAGPPAWLSGDDETSEAVPDWLRSAVSQSEDLAGAAPQAPDVPLWLQDLENQPTDIPVAPAEPEVSDVPAPPAEQESLPPWLRDQANQPTAENIPAWLREPEPPAQPQPGADVPAWLQQEPAAGAAESMRPAEAEDADTLPGVLRPDLASAPPEPAPAPPSPADDLPDWLRPSTPIAAPDAGQGQDLPPWLRDEAGQPLPTAGNASDTNLPAWLRGASAEAPAAPPRRPEPPLPPTKFDWLDQATEAETLPASAESEFFGGTELPAWLRPPEPEQPKEISRADARSLDWLTRLGGMDEAESLTPAAVAAPRLSPPITRSRTPAQVEALALMQQLAATPFPDAAPVPAPAQPSALRRVGMERVLYLALLIALLIGLTVPLPESFGLAAPPSAPGAADLFGQIEKLSEHDVVLIGYEWDARRSSELRPLEDAVLGHLIQRKVKLVLVSTDPQGTLLLFDFRDQLEKAGYRKGGEDYILLGYKPGAELALRSFAQDFRGVLRSDFQGSDATISVLATGADPNKPRLTSLNDFSMVMVLADEAQDVQGWMEQVRRTARQVPFGFLLPAETTPVVQPYLSQPGIYHLAGKQGALAYQNLRGGTGMPAELIARESAQQRLSLLVFVALLLLGAIVGGASVAARRGRSG